MKKVLSIVLVVLMHISLVAFVFCDAQISDLLLGKDLKFGVSVTAAYGEIKNASGEEDGSGEAVVNIAAVLVDKKGRIVKCTLDCASSKAMWTSEGEAVPVNDFKTKYELGDGYGMVAWGGAVKEWYQQADAFAKVCEGKTVDEIKAMVVDGYKGNEEIIAAGCTIAISDFVSSVENAVLNATWCDATDEDSVEIGVQTSASTDNDAKTVKISSSVVCAAVNTNKEIIISSTDVAELTFAFNEIGESVTDTASPVITKRAAGFDYKMSEYGIYQDMNGDDKVLEWFQQADAFDASLKGKNKEGVAALADEIGYGSDALQAAGCTIHIGDMVKAAIKVTE